MTLRERRAIEAFITKQLPLMRRDLKRLRAGEFPKVQPGDRFYVLEDSKKVVGLVQGLDQAALVRALDKADWPTEVEDYRGKVKPK